MSIEDFCESIKPVNSDWTWSWHHCENYAAMELVGTFKNYPDCIIQTMIAYNALLRNDPKCLDYVNETVRRAEAESAIIGSPLWSALREQD